MWTTAWRCHRGAWEVAQGGQGAALQVSSEVVESGNLRLSAHKTAHGWPVLCFLSKLTPGLQQSSISTGCTKLIAWLSGAHAFL